MYKINAWSRGAPSFSPGLHYTGQAFKRRNVVRFKNKGAKEDLPDRRHVIRELLCNQMGFTPADILAVINLPDRQGYDISFKLMASLDRFWASVTKFRGAEGWDQFILIPVSKPGTVSVNILFWNESVPPQDIVIWLRRHCDMVFDLTKCLDDDGIWTGGWRVLVKLRQHSNVTLHLPNSFFIGRERGVCFYAGQPRLCFKCGKAGHVAGVCTVVKCNLCGEIGHTSAMCTNVRCNLCGQMVERDYGPQGTPNPFESCRDKVAKKLVMALRDTQGNLQESQAGILGVVKTFYEDLFHKKALDQEKMLHFLESSPKPDTRDVDFSLLTADITMEEVKEAISSLHLKKTPGPDGLPAEFYKKFKDLLAPILADECDFQGVPVPRAEPFTVLAYADDVTVVLSDPGSYMFAGT
ncbi:uncharacterized protein PAF06_017153 [Gastrophryne carolinensis]